MLQMTAVAYDVSNGHIVVDLVQDVNVSPNVQFCECLDPKNDFG